MVRQAVKLTWREVVGAGLGLGVVVVAEVNISEERLQESPAGYWAGIELAAVSNQEIGDAAW